MANYENTVDLKKEVLQHAGELDDGTSEYEEKVITFLNRAQQALVSGGADLGLDIGQPFPWAKKNYPSVLIVNPVVANYLVDVTSGSKIITFTVAPTVSFQNYYLSLEEDGQMYRIVGHAAGLTTATLDSVYLESSASAASSKIMKYDYALDPGILRFIGPFSCRKASVMNYYGKIEMIDLDSFSRDYPMNIREGIPDRVTQIFKDNAMKPTVRFNRIPSSTDDPIRIEYDYVPVPDDLIDDSCSIPVVPRDHRVTLVYYAAYYLLMDKNDNRAAEYRELARAGMLAMVRAMKIEKANTNINYGRFIPRPDEMCGIGFRRNWRGYY